MTLPDTFLWLMDAYARQPGNVVAQARLDGAWMMAQASGMQEEVTALLLKYDEVDRDILKRVISI